MKEIIAVRGPSKVGKTTSIKHLFDSLNRDYIEKFRMPRKWKDIIVVIEKDGVLIGVGSGGDTYEIVKQNLDIFHEYKCEIIVCACRTRGGPMEAINEYVDKV